MKENEQRCKVQHIASRTNIKHLYDICTTSTQRIRRWSNIVHMLFKYFVCTDIIYMTP